MPTLETIRVEFTKEIVPARQRVRAGELSRRDLAPLLEETFARKAPRRGEQHRAHASMLLSAATPCCIGRIGGSR